MCRNRCVTMLPAWRLIRNMIIIIFIMLFSMIPTSFAIGVSFSVSDSTGSVAISDSYTVSDSVSVHESGSGGFSPASISNSRSVSGPGSIKMLQKYLGSGGYKGYNNLFSKNASNNIESSAALSPNTLSVSQRASFSNAELVKFCLGACMGQEFVKQYGWLEYGSIHMDQSLNVDDGMTVQINSGMAARKSIVGSKAMDGLGSRAETEVEITEGKLSTTQIAKELTSPGNIMAMASQSSDLSALAAIARSSASSYTGNKAGVLVELTDGKMTTKQNAWADKLAVADENSKVWEAQGASSSSSSYAKNALGDKVYSKVKVDLSNGTFNSKQIAVANNNLDIRHQADAGRALSATSYAYALVHDRYLAGTYTNTRMDLGNFSSNSRALVNKSSDSAASYQLSSATNTLLGSSSTLAMEFNGNKSKTYAGASMDNGNFTSDLGAKVDGNGALAAQKTNATKALTGLAFSRAVNGEGDRADTSVTATMNSGFFNNTMGVLSEDENVSIYHKADASSALTGTSDALARMRAATWPGRHCRPS